MAIDNDFTQQILSWYEVHQRQLPWRNISDPYRIWVSEIILQQTRITQGYEYYLRFIKAFPTVANLAHADEDEVLKLWQGLGYYSRARNMRELLHKRFSTSIRANSRLPIKKCCLLKE